MWEEPVHVVWRHYQDWVLPPRVVRVILTVALLFVFVGMILLSVGAGIHNDRLTAGGGVLAGVGGCGVVVCLLLCLHACFIFRVRDQAVQTEDSLWREEDPAPTPIPNHPTTTTTITPHHPTPNLTLTLPLPSALKSSASSWGGGGDSTLRRPPGSEAGSGTKKSVSYSGEVQCYSPLTTPSPTSPSSATSSSFFPSVFSSPAGTLERGGEGGGPSGWSSLPPPSTRREQSHSLPPSLQKLIQDNDYDVPVERTPMLAATARLRQPPRPAAATSLPPGLSDRGSVHSAGAEVSMPPPSSYLSRQRTLETGTSSAKTSDYDNV